MDGQRIIWIDYAKAIGIFLVILGHVPVPADIKWAIYGIHMPLFFIISGYLKSQKDENWVKKTKKLANSLLVPYAIYCIAITLMYCFIKNGSTQFLISNVALANYAALVGDFTTLCPVWFIVSLATMKLFDIILKIAPPQWRYVVGFTILAIAISYANISNYFMIKTTILCVPFYYLGVYVKEIGLLKEGSLMTKQPLWVIVLGFAVSLVASRLNGMVNLTTCEIETSYLLFLLSGSLGSISMFELLRRLTTKTNNIIRNISEGTLLIMSVHYLLIKPITTFLPSTNVFMWIIDSFIILSITYCLILLSKRCCPVLLGKQIVFK